jgi:hypothetical protein
MCGFASLFLAARDLRARPLAWKGGVAGTSADRGPDDGGLVAERCAPGDLSN